MQADTVTLPLKCCLRTFLGPAWEEEHWIYLSMRESTLTLPTGGTFRLELIIEKKFMQSCHYIHCSGRSLLPGYFLRTTWNFGRLRSCSLAWQQGKLCDTICVTKFKTAIIDGLIIYFCRA